MALLAYPHYRASLPRPPVWMAWVVTAQERRAWVDTAPMADWHQVWARSVKRRAWATALAVARWVVDVTERANAVAVRVYLWCWLHWTRCDGSVWYE